MAFHQLHNGTYLNDGIDAIMSSVTQVLVRPNVNVNVTAIPIDAFDPCRARLRRVVMPHPPDGCLWRIKIGTFRKCVSL